MSIKLQREFRPWSDSELATISAKLNVDASVTGRSYSRVEVERLLDTPWQDRIGDLFDLVEMVKRWRR